MPDPAPRVTVAGGFDTAFTWQTQRCEEWDVPDAPARAFRDASGQIILFTSDDKNRPSTGPSLLQLRHGCAKAMVSRHDPDPAAHAGASFITATWTEDGRHVAALVHTEYHAEHYAGQCRFTASMACWYNVIVAAQSRDGGRSFSTARTPVLVAGPAFRQDVDQGRHRGFFNPSNIVKRGDFYYFMANTTGGGAQRPGTCLFRSPNPLDPTSWRGLTTAGYTYRATDPYHPQPGDVEMACLPIRIGGAPGSISYHLPSRRYLAVMQTGPTPEAPTGAIRYSWSTDLITWSNAVILLRLPILGLQSCADGARYAYPSLIDARSPSRNFDVIGDTPYLFLTRMAVAKCHETVDRDLLRIRLRIAG